MCATWGPEVDALAEITEPVPIYEGLGELQFDVTSSSGEAKAYFLQGYKLANAFNHLYIHATEASNEPQKALASAARLPGLAPGAGHLVHMPSHTYIRTGDYRPGSIANLQSILADSAYLSQNHVGGPYPLGYFPHNYHFLVATAALEGNSTMALEAAERMARQIDTAMMREPVMSTLQHYRYIPLYTMVKFGKWDAILAQPRPAVDLLYPNIIWRYARGMAFLGKGDAGKARMELAGIDIMKDDPQLEEITIWYINHAGQLAHIASRVLAGEIALAEKRYDEAVALFREAVTLGDALLAASLEGRQKNAEAETIRQQFASAWAYADGRLRGSRWE